ncbi:MAG: ABC-type transport system, involved in lipoprotein release, permease component [Clostridiales bacterium]|jgi:putative ABC transport system permease protein|nr:ABC-type transport system, involved in lipoprotein release, permease component [Clostridiales bacterium]
MWKKNFRTRKIQTALIVIVILLCSALLTSATSILIALDKPYDEFSKECDSASAILFTYSKEDTDIYTIGEQFASLNNVKRVEYVDNYYLDEEVTTNGEKIEAFLEISQYNKSVHSKFKYLEGNKNAASFLEDWECVIPASIGITYNIQVGETVDIHFSEGLKSYKVKGIYTSPYSVSTAFDSEILINKIPEELDSRLMVCLYGKEGFNGSDIEIAYREKYDGQLAGRMYTLEERISISLITGNIIGAAFLAIGIIMLFVSALIIHFMIRNAMITDAKKIAIFKTMGYSSNDILKMYLIFYFVIVSFASLVGIIGSVFISDKVLSTIYDRIGQVKGTNVAIPGILCYLITVGFVLLVIWMIIAKTKKVRPVVALAGNTNDGIKKKKKYKGNSKIQFSPLGIALRTISRGKRSVIGLLVTCIFTIFAINFGIISIDVANTMKENNDYWLGVEKCDVVIDIADSKSFERVHDIVNEDEKVVNSNYCSYDNLITMKWSKGMRSTSMHGLVYDDYSMTNLQIVEGRNPSTGKEIAIASKMSGELKKTVGDYIEIYLNGTKKIDLLITGIYQTYYNVGESCRITTDVYKENGIDLKYNNISIYLREGEDIDTFVSDIRAKIGDEGDVVRRTEQFSSIMDMIVIPQQKALPPVVILVLLLGGTNIFCIVMLKNANAQKINATYKCIGYSTKHLIKANMYYVGLLAVASMSLALPISIISYPSIMKLALSVFGFLEYPVMYTWSHIAITNIGIIILFVISTLISSKSLHKVNARDLVQE